MQTPNATSVHIIVSKDRDEGESGKEPLVHCKRNGDSIASVALVVVLSGGEGSSGRVVKRSRSLGPGVFRSIVASLRVGQPSTYTA